jgi:TPR repeat protein
LFDQAKHIVDETSDYEAARAKLFEAADKYKYPPALNEYGDYLYYGRGGPTDEVEAVKYFQLAADVEDALGLYNLAYMYNYKRGGLDDEEKAKELYLKASEKGHPYAKDFYNSIVYQQETRKHDLEVVQGVIAAAEGGDAEAKYKLAQYYQYGTTGLDRNTEKGLENLRSAADAGYVPAIVFLGQCYDYAYFDLQEDDVTALEWYRRAAEQGDENAFYKIGEFYENGYGGLEVNIDTAKENYLKGGCQGQWAIDRIETPARNRAELQRLNEAVEAGDAEAQYLLGKAYDYGQLGLSMDEPKAVELYRASADAGNVMGQVYLALYYLNGRDWLEPDRDASLELAKKYSQLAADQGNTDAASYVTRYFSGKSFQAEGNLAVVSGVSRSDGKVVVEFEATADGTNGTLQVSRCAAASLLLATAQARLCGERSD